MQSASVGAHLAFCVLHSPIGTGNSHKMSVFVAYRTKKITLFGDVDCGLLGDIDVKNFRPIDTSPYIR